MDEWRIQQQQHRMLSGGVGPVLGYHSIRSRSSPYPTTHHMTDIKQSYQYQQNSSATSLNPLSPSTSTTTPNASTTPVSTKNDSNDTTSASSDEVSTTTTSNPDVYTPTNTNVSYTPVQMEQIQQQQQQQQHRIMASKSSLGPMVGYNAGQQQIMAARARSIPYPMHPPSHHHHPQQQHQHPAMYPHASGPVCQCAQHMHTSNGHYPVHPSQHPMYYQQQQQQHEAWYRYHQQQAAWRQHQLQQQQHLQSHPQPVSIEQSYNTILSDTTSTTKLKATKTKTKKKQSNIPSLNEEPLIKYQPIPPSSLNLSAHQQQQRACIPPQSTAYYPAVYSTSNPYVPAQQLPPPPPSSVPQEHPLYAQTSPSTFSHHQSQIFTSPLSNPSTPHQLHNGEFNGTAEFGVPYQHGAPGSVNSLTDALCPGGDTTDRQMTPGPPSVGTPRVAPHQYSFPHTPLTPQTINSQSTNPHTPVMMPPTPNPLSAPPTPLTRPRSSSEQQIQSITNQFPQYEQNKSINNVDDLTAYFKDPTNAYLTDDVSSTLFDDIDALANTYLGQQSNNQQQTHATHNSADDMLINFLCSDDLTD